MILTNHAGSASRCAGRRCGCRYTSWLENVRASQAACAPTFSAVANHSRRIATRSMISQAATTRQSTRKARFSSMQLATRVIQWLRGHGSGTNSMGPAMLRIKTLIFCNAFARECRHRSEPRPETVHQPTRVAIRCAPAWQLVQIESFTNCSKPSMQLGVCEYPVLQLVSSCAVAAAIILSG